MYVHMYMMWVVYRTRAKQKTPKKNPKKTKSSSIKSNPDIDKIYISIFLKLLAASVHNTATWQSIYQCMPVSEG